MFFSRNSRYPDIHFNAKTNAEKARKEALATIRRNRTKRKQQLEKTNTAIDLIDNELGFLETQPQKSAEATNSKAPDSSEVQQANLDTIATEKQSSAPPSPASKKRKSSDADTTSEETSKKRKVDNWDSASLTSKSGTLDALSATTSKKRRHSNDSATVLASTSKKRRNSAPVTQPVSKKQKENSEAASVAKGNSKLPEEAVQSVSENENNDSDVVTKQKKSNPPKEVIEISSGSEDNDSSTDSSAKQKSDTPRKAVMTISECEDKNSDVIATKKDKQRLPKRPVATISESEDSDDSDWGGIFSTPAKNKKKTVEILNTVPPKQSAKTTKKSLLPRSKATPLPKPKEKLPYPPDPRDVDSYKEFESPSMWWRIVHNEEQAAILDQGYINSKENFEQNVLKFGHKETQKSHMAWIEARAYRLAKVDTYKKRFAEEKIHGLNRRKPPQVWDPGFWRRR